MSALYCIARGKVVNRHQLETLLIKVANACLYYTSIDRIHINSKFS